jgi:hypothetical protein
MDNQHISTLRAIVHFCYNLIEILIIMHNIAYPEVEGQSEQKNDRQRQLLKKEKKKKSNVR